MADWSNHDPLAFVERFTNPLQDDMDRLYQRLAQNFQKIEDWAEHLFSIAHTHTKSEITDFAHASNHQDGGSDELALENLASNANAAEVMTSQTTTSTSYTDLTTAGPDVTLTPGASGLVLVSIYSRVLHNTIHGQAFMGFALSSGNTLAANDNRAFELQLYTAGGEGQMASTFLLTGLAAASTLFRAKYRTNTGTATFVNRRIAVVPL